MEESARWTILAKQSQSRTRLPSFAQFERCARTSEFGLDPTWIRGIDVDGGVSQRMCKIDRERIQC
jgi:hypothetical protein